MRIVAWNIFLASAISYSCNPADAFLSSNSNACFMRRMSSLNLQSKSCHLWPSFHSSTRFSIGLIVNDKHEALPVTHPVKVTVTGTALSMSKRPDDDDEEDDDDYIDDADLGDWRSFRRTLVDSDYQDSSSSESNDFSEGGFIGEASPRSNPSSANANEKSTSKDKRPKSVSKKNEELLRDQSETLAKEYMEGIWAHESSGVSKISLSTLRVLFSLVLVFPTLHPFCTIHDILTHLTTLPCFVLHKNHNST